MNKLVLRIWNYFERKDFKKVLRSKNITIGNNVVFKKIPIIQIHPNSKLIIENNVTINSDNYGYHVNMFSKCKLMADLPHAYIKIGENSRIHGSCIHAYQHIEIGKNCLVAANCQIIDCNGHNASFDDVDNRINTKGSPKKIVIEDSVWLATGVVVLPGVKIGRGSIIGANSIVACDIPPMVIAYGNPAKVVKKIIDS